MEPVRSWLRRYSRDPQVVLLSIILLALVAIVYLFGPMLAPLFAAVIVAYLLDGLVARMMRRGVPKLASVLTAFILFVAVAILAVVVLLPKVAGQLTQLLRQVPNMIVAAQQRLLELPSRYPDFVAEEQVREIVSNIGREMVSFIQTAASYSLTSLVTAITIGVYLVLVPILVFFLLKDKDVIIDWITSFLPRERHLTDQVWTEVNGQISNYVRGKVWEIFIVGAVTFVVFRFLGLDFALLLAVLTGFSVVIPFVGAFVITVPVALVAYFQWGLDPQFYTTIVAYAVIQFLDGNLLVPLLFSEAVNLHPVAIIVAILVFGGLWGFWGVFFAIPLATVIKAVLRAWPRKEPGKPPDEEPVETPAVASGGQGG